MLHLKSCYMDKQTIREVGQELWKLCQERRMYLRTVAHQTNLPERIIEGMENGKFIQYTTFRSLTEFYGKKMRVVFE